MHPVITTLAPDSDSDCDSPEEITLPRTSELQEISDKVAKVKVKKSLCSIVNNNTNNTKIENKQSKKSKNLNSSNKENINSINKTVLSKTKNKVRTKKKGAYEPLYRDENDSKDELEDSDSDELYMNIKTLHTDKKWKDKKKNKKHKTPNEKTAPKRKKRFSCERIFDVPGCSSNDEDEQDNGKAKRKNAGSDSDVDSKSSVPRRKSYNQQLIDFKKETGSTRTRKKARRKNDSSSDDILSDSESDNNKRNNGVSSEEDNSRKYRLKKKTHTRGTNYKKKTNKSRDLDIEVFHISSDEETVKRQNKIKNCSFDWNKRTSRSRYCSSDSSLSEIEEDENSESSIDFPTSKHSSKKSKQPFSMFEDEVENDVNEFNETRKNTRSSSRRKSSRDPIKNNLELRRKDEQKKKGLEELDKRLKKKKTSYSDDEIIICSDDDGNDGSDDFLFCDNITKTKHKKPSARLKQSDSEISENGSDYNNENVNTKGYIDDKGGDEYDDDDDDDDENVYREIEILDTRNEVEQNTIMACPSAEDGNVRQIFAQLLLSCVHDSSFLSLALTDDYFVGPWQAIQRKLKTRQILLETNSWSSSSFKDVLLAFPKMGKQGIQKKNQNCEACQMQGHVASFLVSFSGEEYDKRTLELTETETVKVTDWELGKNCCQRAELYHKIVHFPYHCLKRYKQKVFNLELYNEDPAIFIEKLMDDEHLMNMPSIMLDTLINDVDKFVKVT